MAFRGTLAGPGPVRMINGPPVQPGPGAHGLVMAQPNGPAPVVMAQTGIGNQTSQGGVVYTRPHIETVVPQVEPLYHQTNGNPKETPLVTESDGRRVEHIPLAKCRVLYLGSAVPMDTAVGLEAVQKPCRERYACADGKSVEGIDAWLIVFSSGIMLQFVGDQASITWWPISTLFVSAAVKCNKGVPTEPAVSFVALDSASGKASSHPPMFAAIMRRTTGIKVLECHIFITKSEEGAMALVQSCAHAYGHKEGWTDDPPPLELFAQSHSHLIPGEKNAHTAPAEFYQKPPDQGYFYSSRQDLVRHYNISGDRPMLEPLPGPRGRPPPPMRQPQLRLPPPQNAGYFADWDASGGQPLAVFPTAGRPVHTRHRRKKHHIERRRHHHHEYSSDSDSSDTEYYFARRRPRTPPADYDFDRRPHRLPVDRRRYNRDDDLVLYAPRYAGNHSLEYIRDGPSDGYRDMPDHYRKHDHGSRPHNKMSDDVKYAKHEQMAAHRPLPHRSLPRTPEDRSVHKYEYSNGDLNPDIFFRESDEYRNVRKAMKHNEEFGSFQLGYEVGSHSNNDNGPNYRIETRPIRDQMATERHRIPGRSGPHSVGKDYRHGDREYFGIVGDVERGLGYYP